MLLRHSQECLPPKFELQLVVFLCQTCDCHYWTAALLSLANCCFAVDIFIVLMHIIIIIIIIIIFYYCCFYHFIVISCYLFLLLLFLCLILLLLNQCCCFCLAACYYFFPVIVAVQMCQDDPGYAATPCMPWHDVFVNKPGFGNSTIVAWV